LIFEALERFLRLGLCFSVFSGWIWPKMKKVAGDDFAGDGAIAGGFVGGGGLVIWCFEPILSK
jgi:hypothetical protein